MADGFSFWAPDSTLGAILQRQNMFSVDWLYQFVGDVIAGTLSVLFGPNWQCFYWYNFMNNFVDLPCMRIYPIKQEDFQKFLLVNDISIPGFC